jgi:6-phosphofructokinase 2
MVAGLVVGLADGADLRDAVRYGVAAGAAAVITPGSELCRRDDVERLAAGMREQETARPGADS